MKFAAKSESPTTTTRDSFLGASGFAWLWSGPRRHGCRDRRRDRDRAGLVALGLIEGHLSAREHLLEVGVRPALRAGFHDRLRGAAARAAGHRRHGPRERERRQQLEPVGDGVLRVGRRDGHRRVRAEDLANATGVHDEVRADLHPQSLISAPRFVNGALSAFSGVDHEEALAPFWR
jgi:hypothetical protein